MGYFWINFANKPAGCIDAESFEDAAKNAAIFGHITGIRRLPYPAEPRIFKQTDCPPFCYTPEKCACRSSCQNNPCCTN